MAFRARLKPTHFAIKIFNNKPKSLADMMKLAYIAMEVEDMLVENFQEQRANRNTDTRNFKKPPFQGNQGVLKPRDNQREIFLELNKKRSISYPEANEE